jgi:flagellar hook protein FlgE
MKAGNNTFTTAASDNTGNVTATEPGVGATPTLMAGYLENSNVDLAKEFTDMITSQRGFQANSKVITVSDEILQELVNMKR